MPHEQLQQWLLWADDAIADDAGRKLAAEAAVLASALGAGKDDAIRAAQSVAGLSLRPTAEGYFSLDGAARRLLAAGWDPPGISTAAFVRNSGEQLLAVAPCDAWVHVAVGRRKGHSWVGGTSPIGLTLLAASAAANVARTAKSVKEAAAKWRQLESSTLWLTNQRLLRCLDTIWEADLLADIHSVALTEDKTGIIIRLKTEVETPYLYQIRAAPAWSVVVNHFITADATPSAELLESNQTQYSADRRYWWDGSVWKDTHVVVPSGVKISPDGQNWWDGTQWRPLPAKSETVSRIVENARSRIVKDDTPDPPPPVTRVPSPGTEDEFEKIRKLAELHEQGIITAEEFAAKKAALLGSI